MTDLIFLKALRDKLKGGNTRSIHLNALPGRFASRLDISALNHISAGTAEKFLDLLFSKASFEFNVSFDAIDFAAISMEDQKRLGLLSKRLNSLYIENEDNFKEHGLKTFGFGYPLLIKRSKLDPGKLIKAPIFIWPLEIVKSYNKVNAWSLLRNKIRNEHGKIVDEEVHSVGLNEVLISFIKTDEDISIAQINEDLLEDAVIDRDELINTCVEVLQSMNAADADSAGHLTNKFNDPLGTIPDAAHFDSVSGSRAWIHFGGVFGLFRTQKESIISDIDRLIARFDEFEFDDLVTGGFSGTAFSAIKTDPSQQELLSTLGVEPKKIIQGPPGTGKSQSLTALITNALANQLKCLVVCEKKTALDVIRQNLNRENPQLGSLAAVIEDINKDRDGIVNSVRERLTTIGNSPYFNQRMYGNSRDTIQATADAINEQHAMLAKKIYQGKSWTVLVGEYLNIEEHADPLVFRDPLDYKEFLFDKDENELQGMLQALKTARQLFLPVKQLNHPLSVLNDSIFDLPNVAEIILTIERHLAYLTAQTAAVDEKIGTHTAAVREWLNSNYSAYSAVVITDIQPHLAFLNGDSIVEQYPLPDLFSFESWALRHTSTLQQHAVLIDTLLLSYKAWLENHYENYYQSVLKEIDDYLAFANDNCNQYGNEFLNNSGFSRFKTNFLGVFSGKYKTVKANRAAIVEKMTGIQQAHAANDYFEHVYPPLVQVADLNVYVKNVKALHKAAREWYPTTQQAIKDYWENTSSGVLHPKYVDEASAVKKAALAYKYHEVETAQKCGFDLATDNPENLHAIKQRTAELVVNVNKLVQQFDSFKTDYASFHAQRELICAQLEQLAKSVDTAKVLNDGAVKPTSLVEAKFNAAAINNKCRVITSHLEEFRDYYHWQIFYREQTPLRKKVIRAAIESGSGDWEVDFHAWYLNWLLSIYEHRNLPKSEDKIQEFRVAKEQFKNLQVANIISYWQGKQADTIRELQRNGLSPTSLFNKRGARGEKRNSLRRIVQTSFELFTNFYPVVMVSPSVCSSILPLQEGIFDIIIFDEASQLRLEDTFPALVRGKIKVISGDSQQMPPSSYFQGGAAVLNPGEEEEEDLTEEEAGDQRRKVNNSLELAESESLLVYAENCNYKQSYLKIHYRSNHPFLIDFSNHAFYGKRLIPMPARTEYRPIRVIDVNGVYEESVNRDEARQVIDILLHHIKPFANGKYPSVGIATFNLYQRNLILEEITRVRQSSPDNDKKINDLGTDLFVKNLENIQGDERDIIILSTTFGKKMDGSFRQMFGPIMQRNGYKLLNVIITRAKYRLFVCTSVPRENINMYSSLLQQNKNTGRGVFYAYLAYAIAVSEGNHETREAILQLLYDNCDAKVFDIEHGVFGSESPFEDEVYYRLAERKGQHLLEQQYKIGGFRIDLMVRSEKTGLPFIAIECDGAKYHSSNEAYAWDMFRQEQLEQYGLIFYRIWSTNWWISPEKEINKLLEFIQAKELLANNNGVEQVDSFYGYTDIVPVTMKEDEKLKVGGQSLVTVKSPDGNILKVKFTKTQNQHNNKKDAKGITTVYERTPLAMALFNRVKGDICQLGMLEVYYEILNVE